MAAPRGTDYVGPGPAPARAWRKILWCLQKIFGAVPVVLAVPGPGVGVGLLVGVEAALVVSVEQLVVAEPGGGGGHAGAARAGLLASAGAARGGRAAEG